MQILTGGWGGIAVVVLAAIAWMTRFDMSDESYPQDIDVRRDAQGCD